MGRQKCAKKTEVEFRQKSRQDNAGNSFPETLRLHELCALVFQLALELSVVLFVIGCVAIFAQETGLCRGVRKALLGFAYTRYLLRSGSKPIFQITTVR